MQLQHNTYLVLAVAIDVDPELCMQLLKLRSHNRRQGQPRVHCCAAMISHGACPVLVLCDVAVQETTHSDKGVKALEAASVPRALLGQNQRSLRLVTLCVYGSRLLPHACRLCGRLHGSGCLKMLLQVLKKETNNRQQSSTKEG